MVTYCADQGVAHELLEKQKTQERRLDKQTRGKHKKKESFSAKPWNPSKKKKGR